jgi:hypothetical protein
MIRRRHDQSTVPTAPAALQARRILSFVEEAEGSDARLRH